MMFFKLISDGRQTRCEIDGKMLGSAVTGVSFKTALDDKSERYITASIDIDLTKGDYKNEAFVDAKPGEFVDIVKRLEEHTEQWDSIHAAGKEVEWQLMRAYDGSAGDVTPEAIKNDLAARTEYIKKQ